MAGIRTPRISHVRTNVRDGYNFSTVPPVIENGYLACTVHAGRCYWYGAIETITGALPDGSGALPLIIDWDGTVSRLTSPPPDGYAPESLEIETDEDTIITTLLAPGTIPGALRPRETVPFSATIFAAQPWPVETEIRTDGSWVITAQAGLKFREFYQRSLTLILSGANYEVSVETDEIPWETLDPSWLSTFDERQRSWVESRFTVIEQDFQWKPIDADPLSFGKHGNFIHVKGKIHMVPWRPLNKLAWNGDYLTSPGHPAETSAGALPITPDAQIENMFKWAPRDLSYHGEARVPGAPGDAILIGVDQTGRRWQVGIHASDFAEVMMGLAPQYDNPIFYLHRIKDAHELETAAEWGSRSLFDISGGEEEGGPPWPGPGGTKIITRVDSIAELAPAPIRWGGREGDFPIPNNALLKPDISEGISADFVVKAGFVGEVGIVARASFETNEEGFRQGYYFFSTEIDADKRTRKKIRKYDTNQVLTPVTQYLIGDEGLLYITEWQDFLVYDGAAGGAGRAIETGEKFIVKVGAVIRAFKQRIETPGAPIFNWWVNLNGQRLDNSYDGIWDQVSEDGPEDPVMFAAPGQVAPAIVMPADAEELEIPVPDLTHMETGGSFYWDYPIRTEESFLEIVGTYPAPVPRPLRADVGAGGIVRKRKR